MLEYNLQFFAKDGPGGEKTEPATEKKLSDSRKEGQVARSKEIANAFMLLALFLIVKYWIGHMGEDLLSLFSAFYNKIPETVTFYDGMLPRTTYNTILLWLFLRILLILAPIFIIGVAVSFLSDIWQVKWQPTAKPLQPKFSKMNPLKGLKKIISPQSLVELLKSIATIAIMSYVVYDTLKDKMGVIFLLYDMPLTQSILLLGELVTTLGLKIATFYMVIALLDWAYQKWKFKEDMKMTKQEVKEEYKNAEGDPQIKGKIKARMREISQRRMMQSLPQADVVITNPTHYAVAIKYEPSLYDAPVVLAKGEDYLALKIKEKAREYKIEIVENKPLARMLYANVEIGGLVPPELYQAVAEVLAMVYKMQGKA